MQVDVHHDFHELTEEQLLERAERLVRQVRELTAERSEQDRHVLNPAPDVLDAVFAEAKPVGSAPLGASPKIEPYDP